MSEKSLNMNSAQGDAFQVSLSVSAEEKLSADQEIQSCIIWTASTTVYVTLYGTAGQTKFLLPAGVLLPIPVDNLKDISVFNNSGSTGALVYVMWRGR